GFACSEEPAAARPRKERDRLLRAVAREQVLTAPAMGFGLAEQEASEHFTLGAARDPAVRTRQARLELVTFERLRGGAGIEGDRSLRPVAALGVLCEDDRLALTHLLEPLRRELVTHSAIFVGEHRVRSLGDERVAEDVLLLSLEFRLITT